MEILIGVVVIVVIVALLFSSNIGKDPSKKTDSMLLREYELHTKRQDIALSSADLDKFSKYVEESKPIEEELRKRGLLNTSNTLDGEHIASADDSNHLTDTHVDQLRQEAMKGNDDGLVVATNRGKAEYVRKRVGAADEEQSPANGTPSTETKKPRHPAKPASPSRAPGTVYRDRLRDDSEGPEMVVIPAGEFLMGSAPPEPERYKEEGPRHRVGIEKTFAIGKYPVTFAEYDIFAEATSREKPNDEGWGRGRRPVIYVSWEDATDYVKWLSTQTGKHYRIPTEAEWEYAARAGTTTPFHYGERVTTEQANFDGTDTYNGSTEGEYRLKTVEVGCFPANAFGLHDVHGNVFEWVEDCWHINYEGAPTNGSAWLEEGGDYARRVIRGGSWAINPGGLRSAIRDWSGTTNRLSILGFRLAQDIE